MPVKDQIENWLEAYRETGNVHFLRRAQKLQKGGC